MQPRALTLDNVLKTLSLSTGLTLSFPVLQSALLTLASKPFLVHSFLSISTLGVNERWEKMRTSERRSLKACWQNNRDATEEE